jgi:hypothetical protein
MAAAEPTRAAMKRDRDACMVSVWLDRVCEGCSMFVEEERLSKRKRLYERRSERLENSGVKRKYVE